MKIVVAFLAILPSTLAQTLLQDGSFQDPSKWANATGGAAVTASPGFSSAGLLKLPAGSSISTASANNKILQQGRNVVMFMLRSGSPGSGASMSYSAQWNLGGASFAASADNIAASGSPMVGWRPKVFAGNNPGGKGPYSYLKISADEDAEVDEFYWILVKWKKNANGAIGGGTLSHDAAVASGSITDLWETSPTSLAITNGHLVIAGYAPSAAPASMKLTFQAMATPTGGPGMVAPVLRVEVYNWSTKVWVNAGGVGGLGTPIPNSLGPVTIGIPASANFVNAAEENLVLARVRPANSCVPQFGRPNSCGGFRTSFKQVALAP